MVLCIDIGNTNIDMCVYSSPEKAPVCFSCATDKSHTKSDYALRIDGIMRLSSIDPKTIDACICASVVPDVTASVCEAITFLCGTPVTILGPGVKTSIDIKTDSPHEVGSDIIANCALALEKYSAPCVIIDFETATTIVSIDENKRLSDVYILPGMMSSYSALMRDAAKLSDVPLAAPKNFSGKNTMSSVNVGVVYSTVYAIDGFIDKISKRFDTSPSIIATGRVADIILPLCKHKIEYVENMTCEGLYRIFLKNSTL